jgi:hypothetical protein
VYINPIVRSTIRVFSREFSAENTIVNKNTFTFDRFVGEISSFSLLDQVLLLKRARMPINEYTIRDNKRETVKGESLLEN